MHWYWQPKIIKHNTTYSRNTKEKQKKTALANKTIYTLIWYGFYYLRSETEWAYSYSSGAHTGEPTPKISLTKVLQTDGQTHKQ